MLGENRQSERKFSQGTRRENGAERQRNCRIPNTGNVSVIIKVTETRRWTFQELALLLPADDWVSLYKHVFVRLLVTTVVIEPGIIRKLG
jgi:hypothetical protein